MTEEHAHGHDRDYVKIWKILVVLLVISIVGPFLEIYVITLITAFGVALLKAYIVAKNFMHLDIEKTIVHFLLIAVLAMMVLMFAGVSPDVMKHQGTNWSNEAAKKAIEAGKHAVEGHKK